MNFIRRPVEEAAIAAVDDPDALSAFLQPGCSAAVWRRQVPSDVQLWLDGLAADALPSGRVICEAHAVSAAARQFFDASGLPDGPERDWLEADIGALADMFATLLQARYLRLRLQAVTTNACRKFHVDAITGRLVCTYRGTGTQYGISAGGDDPSRVHTVPTGHPILLRGTLWPAEPPTGLVHRSPPIEGTGETRLVLVLDPVFDPDEDA